MFVPIKPEDGDVVLRMNDLGVQVELYKVGDDAGRCQVILRKDTLDETVNKINSGNFDGDDLPRFSNKAVGILIEAAEDRGAGDKPHSHKSTLYKHGKGEWMVSEWSMLRQAFVLHGPMTYVIARSMCMKYNKGGSE